jgi:uncharacterized membrane-anchored protein
VAKKSKAKTAQAGAGSQTTKQPVEKKTKAETPNLTKPWISMRSAIIIITVVSIGQGIVTSYNAIQTKGLVEGILWGLLFGGSIWVIFLGLLLFNKFIRRA